MSWFLSKRDVRDVLRDEQADPDQLPTKRHKTLLTELQNINRKLDIIMATQAELAAELAEKTAQIRKAIDEINTRLGALQDAINRAPVIPELAAAAQALGVAVQAADDIVPDAPPA